MRANSVALFDLTTNNSLLDRDCDNSTHFKSLAIQLADATVRNVRRADSHRSLSGSFGTEIQRTVSGFGRISIFVALLLLIYSVPAYGVYKNLRRMDDD